MNTDPVDVVARAIYGVRPARQPWDGDAFAFHEPHASHDRDLALRQAELSIVALREAGFELVKLHDRPTVNSEDNAVWCQAPYIEQEFGGDVIISDRLGIDRGELRDVAVALLSAERAAYDD